MKLRKKVQLFLLSIVIVCGTALNAAALTPENNFYVNDYVGILSGEHKAAMISAAEQLAEANDGVQVVAVITDYCKNENIAAYGVEIFNEFGIGSREYNNGLLLLITFDDGWVDITVGNGMTEVLTDFAAGRLLDDYFMPLAWEGSLDQAIYQTYMQLIAYGYEFKKETDIPSVVNSSENSSISTNDTLEHKDKKSSVLNYVFGKNINGI